MNGSCGSLPGLGVTDANGNSGGTFDVENRLVSQGSMNYVYDPWGKRISQYQSGQFPQTSTVYFYGITGQRLQIFNCTTDDGSGNNPRCTAQASNVYFGRKLIIVNGMGVATDRLGSVRFNSSGQRVSY